VSPASQLDEADMNEMNGIVFVPRNIVAPPIVKDTLLAIRFALTSVAESPAI